MLCAMVTRSRQLRSRTFRLWTFLGTVAEMLSRPLHHAWCWSITQIVENFLPRPAIVLPILVRNVWAVSPRGHTSSPGDGSQDMVGKASQDRRALRLEPRAVTV